MREFIFQYTSEEIDWYGYSFEEACNKIQKILEEKNKPVPLKHLYRAKLIESLKKSQSEESPGEKVVSS